MKNEVKFTMKEVKEQLTLAIGEAFARAVKEKATNVMARPVKMKDWLGTTEDDMIPEKLDYITEEDFITARISYDGKYVLTYFADDGMTFSITDEDYYQVVNRFIETFLAIYRA